jgi:hypothetical protein
MSAKRNWPCERGSASDLIKPRTALAAVKTASRRLAAVAFGQS